MPTIRFSVESFEHADADFYARCKGFGGQNPAATLAKYAMFAYMKKYPLLDREILRQTRKESEFPAKILAAHIADFEKEVARYNREVSKQLEKLKAAQLLAQEVEDLSKSEDEKSSESPAGQTGI